MKHTKQNIVAVLRKMESNKMALAHIFREEGNERLYGEYVAEACGISAAIAMLTSKEYFDSSVANYMEED